MSLQSTLRPLIASASRARGEGLVHRGCVGGPYLKEPHLLVAMVQGTRAYHVQVQMDAQGELWAHCNCPAYENFGPCKHLWAVALEADAAGMVLRPGPGQVHPFVHDSDSLATGLVGRRDAFLDDDAPGEIEDFYEEDDDEDDDEYAYDQPDPIAQRFGSPRTPAWKERLKGLRAGRTSAAPPFEGIVPPEGRLLYVLDLAATRAHGQVELAVRRQRFLRSGRWGAAQPVGLSSARMAREADPVDLELLRLLELAQWGDHRASYAYGRPSLEALPTALMTQLLAQLCDTGRFYLDDGETDWTEGEALSRDDGPPWVLGLRMRPAKKGKGVRVEGFLERGGVRIDLAEPSVLLNLGFLVRGSRLEGFDPRGAMTWVVSLRRHGPLEGPASARQPLLDALLALPDSPLLDLGEVAPERVVVPTPHLEVGQPSVRVHRYGRSRQVVKLPCRIFFDYDGTRVRAYDPRPSLLAEEGEVFPRDRDAERAALHVFLEAGGEAVPTPNEDREGQVAPRALTPLVLALLDRAWTVKAEGRLHRTAGTFSMSVKSGIDWFDLEGGMDFGGEIVPLPALLEAARDGNRTVELGDGSVGILPERWLEGWEMAEELGRVEGGAVRFGAAQGWVLDALLAGRDDAQLDRRFQAFRKRLASFSGIKPAKEPKGFQGELRDYQRGGLAWLKFLEGMGFGGCLADDMGLGKTVQVLALLEARRASRKRYPPSLVVAPRSVVHNWIDEAGRFAPKLKVLDYTGTGRLERREAAGRIDLLITTYGTLRRDILALREERFDLAILDEAQAIKNAQSQSAKAARLLQADHRIALSGTPIENHLGELWSLFEFLNPGMLGRAAAFKRLAGGQNGRALDEDGRQLLARAVRPFVLRRTKEQVLKDLPAKTEQVLHCEMKGAQKKEYEKARSHVRSTLLSKIDGDSLGRSKIHVLEALLRLRQAACHVGLMDKARAGETSAKLDALLPHLEEIVASGHKALVFSQFTRFLAIVRDRLDERGIAYEYLDGRTRNRKAKVERFQNDADCPVFLISLKAGGLGLNLTAADYVFLLDPWWNPAVERQAMDRAHRIGQTRPVMVYRLIASGTVEEKVLELQAEKKKLADAVIGEDASVLKSLTREDLEILLG